MFLFSFVNAGLRSWNCYFRRARRVTRMVRTWGSSSFNAHSFRNSRTNWNRLENIFLHWNFRLSLKSETGANLSNNPEQLNINIVCEHRHVGCFVYSCSIRPALCYIPSFVCYSSPIHIAQRPNMNGWSHVIVYMSSREISPGQYPLNKTPTDIIPLRTISTAHYTCPDTARGCISAGSSSSSVCNGWSTRHPANMNNDTL